MSYKIRVSGTKPGPEDKIRHVFLRVDDAFLVQLRFFKYAWGAYRVDVYSPKALTPNLTRVIAIVRKHPQEMQDLIEQIKEFVIEDWYSPEEYDISYKLKDGFWSIFINRKEETNA